MSNKRPLATMFEVEAKIQDIEEHHDIGRQSFKLPAKMTISQMASYLGCTAAKLLKARQFAHPQAGYSPSRLEELCDCIREHRPVFGTAHIGLLVTVPGADREQMQHDCIVNNWSVKDLITAIKTQFTPRSHGGRHPAVTADSVHVLLEEFADSWRRLVLALTRSEPGKPPILDQLSPHVRSLILDAYAMMMDLLQMVRAELAAIRVDS